MSTVFLNGSYMPMAEAKISPMDRGFLFGDGVYEVIPSYDGKMVGFGPHMQRLNRSLAHLELTLNWSDTQWREVCEALIEKNGGGNLGLYLHVSRGADSRRFHAYPEGLEPTIFAFAFDIAPSPQADRATAKTYRVKTQQDLRWDRCHIKSTALLGNVMHFQAGHAEGMDETVLYNSRGDITEASACNVFVVKNGVVATPLLDEHILPGITRQILIEVLRADGSIPLQERVVTIDELRNADEVWLTSSSKDVAPVIEIDGVPVADGKIGDVWLKAQALFSAKKFSV